MMNRIKYLSKRVLPIEQVNEENKSREELGSQKIERRYDIFSRRPSRRYNKSNKDRFEGQKLEQIDKLYNTPESFLSQNLRLKQPIRDRSSQKMKSTQSEQKFLSPPVPFTPLSHLKRLKHLQILKNKSFFNTNCSSLQNSDKVQNIEELFYKQVSFAQVCKSIERNAK